MQIIFVVVVVASIEAFMVVNKINGMLCNKLITDDEGNEDGRGKCSKNCWVKNKLKTIRRLVSKQNSTFTLSLFFSLTHFIHCE